MALERADGVDFALAENTDRVLTAAVRALLRGHEVGGAVLAIGMNYPGQTRVEELHRVFIEEVRTALPDLELELRVVEDRSAKHRSASTSRLPRHQIHPRRT